MPGAVNLVSPRVSRPTATLSLVLAALLVGSVFGSSAQAARGGGKKPVPDTTRPLVAIITPASGALLAGSVSVGGTAFDNAKLAKVEVSVDGGAFAVAAGTTAWTHTLDTRDRADGPHTITARAVDAAGNTTVTSVSVSFKNASSAPPPPPRLRLRPTPHLPWSSSTSPGLAPRSPARCGSRAGPRTRRRCRRST